MALKKRMFEKIQLLKRRGIPPMEAYKRLKRDGIAISKPGIRTLQHILPGRIHTACSVFHNPHEFYKFLYYKNTMSFLNFSLIRRKIN